MATKSTAAISSGLKKLFTDKLDESGLGGMARKLQLELMQTPPPGLVAQAGGFVIPYFDFAGKPTKFWRYRYLENPAKGSFEAITDRKPLRYSQPANTTTEVYLPPMGWANIAKDTSFAVVITEGELKAACSSFVGGHPTIGLGGVWSFRSAAKNMAFLPQLQAIDWNERTVYVVFDSDAAKNPMVLQAEHALAAQLTKAGAVVYIVRIPPGVDGAKMGVDDYIMAHGAEGYQAMLDDPEQTTEWAAAKELHRLNSEVVYVRDPGFIIEIATQQRIAPRAFIDHAYSTRVYTEAVESTNKEGKSTVKLVEKSAPREWIKWAQRSEVRKVVYEPGFGVLTEGSYNIWPGWGCAPKRGSIEPWTRLLDYMFGKNKVARQWFERWCACPIQNPGIKMYTSALIWGLTHGTGKSFIGYSLFKIYGRNSTEIKDRNLHESHNEWAENKQFVMGDEITGGDKRGTSDNMKSIITQQELRLNPKYIPSYTVRDCINYYFTSNHCDAFFIEDDDRRNFIWESPSAPLPFEFYREYEKWIGAPGETGPGASALFYHLLNLDMGDFDPRARAPMTHAKQEMVGMGRSDIAGWVAQLRENPDSVLRIGGEVIPYALWRSEDLLRIYDPEGRGRVTVNGMSRELTKARIYKCYNGNGVPTATHGQVRLWMVRQIKPGAELTLECGKIYDTERSIKLGKYVR